MIFKNLGVGRGRGSEKAWKGSVCVSTPLICLHNRILVTQAHNNGGCQTVSLPCFPTINNEDNGYQWGTCTHIHYGDGWFVDGYFPIVFRQNSKNLEDGRGLAPFPGLVHLSPAVQIRTECLDSFITWSANFVLQVTGLGWGNEKFPYVILPIILKEGGRERLCTIIHMYVHTQQWSSV